MYMGVLPKCMSVDSMHVWYPLGPEEGVRSPGNGVPDSCELPWEGWKLNLSLEEQSVLFTTEPVPRKAAWIIALVSST